MFQNMINVTASVLYMNDMTKDFFVSVVAARMDWTMTRLKDFHYAYSLNSGHVMESFSVCALIYSSISTSTFTARVQFHRRRM